MIDSEETDSSDSPAEGTAAIDDEQGLERAAAGGDAEPALEDLGIVDDALPKPDAIDGPSPGEAPGAGHEVTIDPFSVAQHLASSGAADDKPAEPSEPGPETFMQRALAVLFMPLWAFSHHRAAWGWARPWLFVSAVGMLSGAVILAKVDMAAIVQEQFERQLDTMPSEQRKRMEAPATKEMMETGFRLNAFFMKVGKIIGPPLGGLAGILFFGGVIFVVVRFLGGPNTPKDLLRCVSLAAYLNLVDVLHYVAVGLGALFGGGGIPHPSPAGWVDAVSNPILAVALSRLDPTVILWYGLLVAGLVGSLKLPKRRAVGIAIGLFLLLSAIPIGAVAVGVLAQGLQTGGGA